jgi:hypothetical protein
VVFDARLILSWRWTMHKADCMLVSACPDTMILLQGIAFLIDLQFLKSPDQGGV